MRYVLGLFIIGIAGIFTLGPVSAHHVIKAKFDPDKALTLTGRVTRVNWGNPHVHVFINVPEPPDPRTKTVRMINWAVEVESTIDLRRSGWNRDSLKPGEIVRVEGITARDGSKQIWGNSIVIAATGAKVFNVDPAKTQRPPVAANQAARPAPRLPDGKPSLGPPEGETGYWAYPSATSLVETGVTVQVDAQGLLANLADVDKVAPFQRWARDLYEYRQRSFLKDDPMFLSCLPPGGPRQFQRPYGTQFIHDPELQRIFVIVGSGNFNWRLIYLDGRQQVGQPEGDADNPLYYGRTVGKWEGDTLVLDTKGFNERFWFSNGGLPHTEQLHLIERISRPNLNTLNYEVTIDDPGAYTRTWTSRATLQWVPGEELPEYYCQDNRP